jgi:hypothetical protein
MRRARTIGVIGLSGLEKPVIWGRSFRRVMDPDWLGWVKRLQAIAQDGLTYATDDYDLDRHGHPPISYHVYKLVFLCEIVDYTPSFAVDADGVAFFGEHELPELSFSRVTPAQIKLFFEHHRGPELPADFD